MIAMLKRIIDDSSISDEIALDFINSAKDELDLERDWYWLIQHDSSITWAASDVYTTQHSLPTGFLRQVAVYVDGFEFPFDEFPWEHKYRFRNLSNLFAIDFYNSKIHFSGTTSQARAVYLAYIKDQGDLVAADSPLGWPAKLHKIFVYKAAELWLAGTDADNVTKLMAPEHKAEYAILRKRAVNMDAKLRSRARNYKATGLGRDSSAVPDVIGRDEL